MKKVQSLWQLALGVCPHKRDRCFVARPSWDSFSPAPYTHSPQEREGWKAWSLIGERVLNCCCLPPRGGSISIVWKEVMILKQSGDFPFLMTHPKAFPPRCSLKAQPSENTQRASLDRLLPPGDRTHLYKMLCEAGTRELCWANIETLQCLMLCRE